MNELSPELKDAVDLLDEGEEYITYFFKRATGLNIFHALKEKGLFSPNNNPKPVEAEDKGYFQIPYWPALDYLIKVAKETSQPENKKYAIELMEIIRDVSCPEEESDKSDNYHTWRQFIGILSLLPSDVVHESDIDLISNWLNGKFNTSLLIGEIGKNLLPKLLKQGSAHDIALAIKIINVTIQNLIESDQRNVRDNYWINDLFQRNGLALGEKCGTKAIGLLSDKLCNIIRLKENDKYTYLWRPAIEGHEQNRAYERDIKYVLTSALRDASLGFVKVTDAHEVNVFITSLFDKDLNIMRRLALFLCNEIYQEASDIFWERIRLNKKWFSDHNVRHELWTLIQHRFTEFSKDKKNEFLNIIEGLVADWSSNDNRAEASNYLKLEWLYAIHGKGFSRADKLYEKYAKLLKHKPSHPQFPTYMEVGWVGHQSPCSVNELLLKSISEIIDYINDFKPKSGWKEPEEEGLGKTLKDAVKVNIKLFTDNIERFLEVKPLYQYYLLQAYKDLYETGQDINWHRLLEFCWDIIKEDAFWERKNDSDNLDEYQYEVWVSSNIADLIKSGVSKDDTAFDPTYLPYAKKILVKLLERELSQASGEGSKPLTDAINTAKGSCIEALFSYSLRRARLDDKSAGNHNDVWDELKPIYDNQLKLCAKGNYEFSALCGYWLPNLLYLNSDWVVNNFDRIFSTTSDKNWYSAIDGYSYVGKLHKKIHTLLRDKGHLQKVLDTVDIKERVRERYIDHISVAYLQGLESLSEGSLFWKLLEAWNQEDVSHIIWFYWTARNRQDDKLRERIVNFWSYCFDKIKGKEKENKKILSDLMLLTAYLVDIGDKEKKLIMQAAQYSEEKYHGMHVVEDLNYLADNNLQAVGEVFLQITNHVVIDYPKDDVRSIVEKLYKGDEHDKANEICDIYLKSGCEILRDIYSKNNR